ncbi:MAG: enoyl-CoA hydratase/isomerase family protein [Parasphingorhabdus sp.]|nr:enoyl-CoA hydratase/isomerase family protein [Parasphingorhabdus sp.]
MNDLVATAEQLGTEHLRLERRGHVAWCTVDRPERRNALSIDMYRGIGRAIVLSERDPEIRAMVLTGSGDVFIPGGEMISDDEIVVPSEFLPFRIMRNTALPLVTAVNGLCFASGLLFAMLADVSIASDKAVFRAPELLRGFPDTWLSSVLPAHVGVGRARELASTARKLDAAEAHMMGLVTRLVPHEELPEAATKAAAELLSTAPLARGYWKRQLSASYGPIDEATLDAAPESDEVLEGFRSFLDKRAPSWVPSE